MFNQMLLVGYMSLMTPLAKKIVLIHYRKLKAERWVFPCFSETVC